MVRADHKPPAEFFMELSLQSNVNIIYSDNLVEKLPPVTLEMKNVSVDEILNEVLEGTAVGYKYVGDQIVLYQAIATVQKYSVSGLVIDSISGEPLISAYVHDERSGKSTLTNEYGYFSLNLPEGEIRLLSGYSGYHQQRRTVDLKDNKILQINLQARTILPTVIVKEKVYGKEIGVIQPVEVLTLADLQSDVQLGGASDLYRAADFIPGVHTGTDGVG